MLEGLPGPLPALEEQAVVPLVAGQQVPQAAAVSQVRRVAPEWAVARRVAGRAAAASQARQVALERADTSGMVVPVPEGRVVSPAREDRALGARPGPEGRL